MSGSRERAVHLMALVLVGASLVAAWGVVRAREAQADVMEAAHALSFEAGDAAPSGLPPSPAVAVPAEPSQPTPGASSSAPPPPPADTDHDGIADAKDRCPTRAETLNGYLDTDGCPDIITTTRVS